jgi:hypothetical protein
MDERDAPAPNRAQILRRVDVQRRGRKIQQDALWGRQFGDQFAQSKITRYLERTRIKPARQNERHAAARCSAVRRPIRAGHTSRYHASPGCAPTRQQPNQVAQLQTGQIDRQ